MAFHSTCHVETFAPYASMLDGAGMSRAGSKVRTPLECLQLLAVESGVMMGLQRSAKMTRGWMASTKASSSDNKAAKCEARTDGSSSDNAFIVSIAWVHSRSDLART